QISVELLIRNRDLKISAQTAVRVRLATQYQLCVNCEMTTGDANPQQQAHAKRLYFDRYLFDLHRGCLLLDGTVIALRPKIFAVLHYLVQNTCRLVSKDELVAAVRSNLAITDDVLVQSIGDVEAGW